jgi:pilus assembly protein CpaB
MLLRRTESTALQNNEAREASRPEPAFVPKVERRKGERRGMEALRDEALRNVISKVEDKNFGGLRAGVAWRARMPMSRIVLLLVALVAGGLAAFLSTRGNQTASEAPVAEPIIEFVQEPKTQILVAREAIGMGQRLSPTSVEWVDWPQGAVRPEYITVAAAPDATTHVAGSVARFEFFPGEPIREQKLARDAQGYLSAVLGSGMRGVSVSVAAESASGGFIVPNDHVDVVVTRTSSMGQVSDTILSNVRVLAINTRLGETGTTGAPADTGDPRAEIFSNTAIATLALDSSQAEVIINATTMGRLSLVLRSILDFAESDGTEQRASNQAIRLSSPFWSE